MRGYCEGKVAQLFTGESSIGRIEIGDWLDRCGGKGDGTPVVLPMLQRGSAPDDQKRHWTPERTKAFQQVVERRTFALYCSFYQDAYFSKWERKA